MRPDDWQLTEDVDDFLARAGHFLRSRPALHTMPLTVTEKLRTRGAGAYGTGRADAYGTGGADPYGTQVPVFGLLEQAGTVRAACYRLPSRGLSPTRLTHGQADALAARLAGLGHSLPSVSADHGTATAFAGAWQRHTGAAPALGTRIRLYRLGTLTPPEPLPEGRGRAVGEEDHELRVRWCGEFVDTVGEVPAVGARSWAGSRFADRHFTFWETPDGAPVAMAAATSMVAGMVRIDPVYTPAHLRGRGYAGAVTAEVSRAALAGGATDVVLFADPANATSNALYQRLGYVPVTEWSVYDFAPAAAPEEPETR
ncbi:GNAT family N-acetyltransferase [Streptomyces armeniacus]|uniref:GNAT family N-acetyltransferase n=1 Tax=Streptomyces armeniacus TaxID=83291 RepID=A0A345XUX7_9ACTN|nr:GNAT family N-acetyltransferase [Streptomyces armeniacus]AXK35443.1 GNAT family N-acetyltransferase [Streptomyces armeniacus]